MVAPFGAHAQVHLAHAGLPERCMKFRWQNGWKIPWKIPVCTIS